MVKAVFFDFMGTCFDWHTGAVKVLPETIDTDTRSNLALEWRQLYFDSNKARLNAGHLPEDIDITLRETLDALLAKYPSHQVHFEEGSIGACVQQWHSMPAWPEVKAAIDGLKDLGLEVFVFANGTSRLQLDLCRSSGLSFDMLFSSALLGIYKPALQSYCKVLELVKLQPEETIMVAAHANDLRGAKQVGMKTIYIKRWTDDVEEDPDIVRKEVDYFLEDMTPLAKLVGDIAN